MKKKKKKSQVRKFCFCIGVLLLTLALMGTAGYLLKRYNDAQDLEQQRADWEKDKETGLAEGSVSSGFREDVSSSGGEESTDTSGQGAVYEILPEYRALYDRNPDMAGWLRIADTVIDYPVMQTPEDEEYYLDKGFDGKENRNGCLILDTDSVVGIGDRERGYAAGNEPSTNLMIHGHTMKSGEMFGHLRWYEDEEYAFEHPVICFDSLYERRQYQVISVFYSQIFYEDEEVFKYYTFFQADTEEEFDYWYANIKQRSLFDTGVTASFGDEFLTLSCCSYQVEDGRFVVIAKRIL